MTGYFKRKLLLTVVFVRNFSGYSVRVIPSSAETCLRQAATYYLAVDAWRRHVSADEGIRARAESPGAETLVWKHVISSGLRVSNRQRLAVVLDPSKPQIVKVHV